MGMEKERIDSADRRRNDKSRPSGLRPGGEEGGDALFGFGFGLLLLALGGYLFLDSVQVTSREGGWVSGAIGRGRQGLETTSMGLVFVPLFLGLVILFYNARLKLGWWLSGLGLAVIVVEILSRIRFELVMKTTHLLIILVMVAAGCGLMFRAYRTDKSRG